MVIGSLSPWTHSSIVNSGYTLYRNGMQLGSNQGFSVAGLFTVVFGALVALSAAMRLAGRRLPRARRRATPMVAGVVGIAVGTLWIAFSRSYTHSVNENHSASIYCWPELRHLAFLSLAQR